MHRLRGVASDVHEEHTPEGIIFTARLPVAEAGRFARFSVEPPPGDEDETPEPDEDDLPREPLEGAGEPS